MATQTNEKSEDYFRDEIQKIRNQSANPNGIAEFKAGLPDNLVLVKKYLNLPNLSADYRRTYEEYLEEAEKLEGLDEQTRAQLQALKQSMKPVAANAQLASNALSAPSLSSAPQAPIDSLKSITTTELSKDLTSFKGEFEKIRALPDVTQYAGWAIFFTKLSKEGYDISFNDDSKKVTLGTNNDTKGTDQEIKNKKSQFEIQILTYLEANPNTRKNILKGLLLQDGIFKSYIEVNSILGAVQPNSISVAEFRKYITTQNRTNTAVGKSISAYDDTLLREAAAVFPTQTELNTSVQSILVELQKRGVIDVNAPNKPSAPPADLRDSFGGNLSLPSSPLVLAGGGLLYGLFKKEGGFLQGLKFGFIGLLVAIFGGMGSDWLKKNLGYDLGFTLGEQKVGLMKLEKKVNDLRNANGQNSRLDSTEMTAVKDLVKEFDTKWKTSPSVSPVGPAVSDMAGGNFDISKRLSDSPELNAYEERINLYYLRAGGGIDSVELQKRLKDVEVKLAKAKTSSTSGATTAGAGAGGAAAAGAGAVSTTPASVPQSSLDLNKLSTEQKKIYDILKADSTLVGEINTIAENNKKGKKVEIGDFNAYMDFIFSDRLQNTTLDKILYTAKPQEGIFSQDRTMMLDVGVPDSLDNNIFKTLMRKYLIGKTELELGSPQGKKERDAFEGKYPGNDHAKKTLHDITKVIYI